MFLQAYGFIRLERLEKTLSRSIKFILLHFLFMFCIISILNIKINHNILYIFYGLFFLEIFFFRLASIKFLKWLRKLGFNFRNVIIIGSGKSANEIYSVLSKDLSYGYRILGFFSYEYKNHDNKNMLGSLENIYEYLNGNTVHEIYVALSENNSDVIKTLSSYCESNLIRLKIVPDYNGFAQGQNFSIDFYDNIPIISLRKEPLESPVNRIIKRLFDITFSIAVILLILLWLFPILFILIKISSKGPVFFKQQRSCENNYVFWCWKFRSMSVNAFANEQMAIKGDIRITKIGKFMRKTNIDELPQFFNTLIGTMSVIGPRPHMLKHTSQYSNLINNYLVRHFTKPGITGWAQVNGFRGETKELDQMLKRIEFDIWYIENWSFLLDLKIIYKTITNMLKGEKNAF